MRKMTISEPENVQAGTLTAQCPACLQMTIVQEESAVIGTEILCRECGAILAVQQTSPLTLVEVEPDEFA